MKIQKLRPWFVVTLLFAAASLAGCGNSAGAGNDSRRSAPLGNASIAVQAQAVLVNDAVVAMATPGAGVPVITGALPDPVTRVVVTVTGENIAEPVVYELVKVNGQWQGIIGNIPPGAAIVTSQAYDNAGNKLYESTAPVTVADGQTISLNMIMEPTLAPDGMHVKAPLIKLVNIAPQKLAPKKTAKLEVVAEDPAPGGPLQYVWTPEDVGTFSDRTSPTPRWTAPDAEGFYQLTIAVIDSEFLIDFYTITMEVDDKYGDGSIRVVVGSNDYPVVASIVADPTRIDRGKSTQLSVDAYDPNDNMLSYQWSATCAGSFNEGTLYNPVFTADPNAIYGPCRLEVKVSDGALVTTGSITINVTRDPGINAAPEIVSMFQSGDRVSPGGKLTFIARATDPEGSEVSFNWKVSGGTFAMADAMVNGESYESRVTWTAPATGGPFIITVEVKDMQGLASSADFIPVRLE